MTAVIQNAGKRGGRTWAARRRSASRERGAVLIWVAILLTVLIGLVGLALDMGYATWTHQQLQVAADAGSLAGAQLVRSDEPAARQAATALAGQNVAARQAVAVDPNDDPDSYNASGGEVVVGWYDRDEKTFTPRLEGPNAVRVVARRTVDSHGPVALFFGPMYGRPTMDISTEAIAMVGGGTGAGLISLSEHECEALHVRGSARLNVSGGDIQVNSDCTSGRGAVRNQGNTVIDAPNINLVGSYAGNGSVTGDINEDADPMPDPLAWLEPPLDYDPDNPPAYDVHTIDGSQTTYSPGYYPGGVNLTTGTVHLEAGVYILDGAGLDIRGNAKFYATEGVMFYIVGSGIVDLGGGGSGAIIQIRPPDDGYYANISIFQARTDEGGGGGESDILGTAGLDLEGTLYFPDNHLRVGGTGDGFGNQLIADTIEVHGTADVTINYDGRFPAAGDQVFLVQ
ncbi:MAG: TadG family pilus assembly protein [Phycisphaeraceae bacterium]